MNKETAKETKTPATRRAYSRARLLGGFVALLLVMWGIKAVHYALQPKYQGKTMEEWFAEAGHPAAVIERGLIYMGPEQEPTVLAMQQFGTNAVAYLWQEYHREDGDLKSWLQHLWLEHVNGELPLEMKLEGDRRDIAQSLLLHLRSHAHMLIPELVAEVNGPDAEKAMAAMEWMAKFAIEPQVCLPVLIRAVELPHHSVHNRVLYVSALASYGADAEAALPVLLKLHDDPARVGFEKWEIAAAIVRIDGHRKNPQWISSMLDPGDAMNTTTIVLSPHQRAPLPPGALPFFEEFAEKVRDSRHRSVIEMAIREIKNRPAKP